ncbi:MAG: PDZ domain-containing protein [Cryomorphaceae bacterium]|nr:PDZ domain-containing protein [Cryomorphaceae bacterium]
MKYFFLKGTLAALTLIISTGAIGQNNDPKSTVEKFNTLLYYIERMYVDSVNSEELVEHAIVHMLEELDPHSVYISKEELAAANEPLQGNFEGIGVQFNILKDTIFVVATIAGGPSEKLGIMAGDKIINVDGKPVAGIGINNQDVMGMLKGPKGTTVKVEIKRGGVKRLLDFDIVRDKIPIYSVDASYMIDDQIGYVKVNRFAKTTMTELREALVKLKSEGMNSLVLDLQGNGGGLLNTAIEMADEFLSDNRLLVYTEGRSFPKDETYSRRPGLFEKGRLVVLIDEGSASASEIVSGAIQDWDRGLIVGRRSFGKGLVQRPVELPDGSAVRLTVQKYYTPSGRCIQKPYDDGIEAYQKEKYERFETGELLSLEKLDLPDSLKFTTNIQKRTVYGGGGILPDIFVPIDTTYSSEYFNDMLRKGAMNQYALTWVDQNRDMLSSKYKNSDEFVKNFEVTRDITDGLVKYVEKEGVPFVKEDWDRSFNAVSIRMKALIGRNLYDYNVFYEVVNKLSPAYMKAINVLHDGTFEKAKLAHADFKN